MSKRYPNRVYLKNMKVVTVIPKDAKGEKSLFGNIPQVGIYYLSESEVVFSTHNAVDLMIAMGNGYWDYGKVALKLKEGYTVYIVPRNDSMATDLKDHLVYIEATASSGVVKLDETAVDNWS